MKLIISVKQMKEDKKEVVMNKIAEIVHHGMFELNSDKEEIIVSSISKEIRACTNVAAKYEILT